MIGKLLLLLLTFIALSAENRMIIEASKGVVRIINRMGPNSFASGTAFSINDDGYYISNAHVVKDAKELFAVKSDSKYRVEIKKIFYDIDIAILKIDALNLPPLRFARRSDIFVTDRVFSIGFPGAADKTEDVENLTTVTINSGVIGKFTKIPLSVRNPNAPAKAVIQHDAAVNHGNSGGPLVNICGQVVGVNVQKALNEDGSIVKIAVGDVVQGIFYAVDIGLVKEALDESNVDYLDAGGKCMPDTPAPYSSSTGDREKYIMVFLLLFLLVSIWGVIYYLQKRRGTAFDYSELSRIVSEKIRKREDGRKYMESPAENIVELQAESPTLPLLRPTRKSTLLGRSRICGFKVENMNVSGRHLAIRIDGKNRVLVKDLGSTNGTYIDGRKLLAGREYILMPGEKLIVGSEDVVYRIVSQGNYDAGRK